MVLLIFKTFFEMPGSEFYHALYMTTSSYLTFLLMDFILENKGDI